MLKGYNYITSERLQETTHIEYSLTATEASVTEADRSMSVI